MMAKEKSMSFFKYISCFHFLIVTLPHHSRCERVSTFCDKNDEECFKRPSSIQYNFVTIVAKNALPPQGRGLFTLVGPHYYEHIDFDFKIVNVRSNIGQRVTERFFK